MRKITTLLACAALAISPTAATAGQDTGFPIPPDTDAHYEYMKFMCTITTLDYYCDWVKERERETPPAPQPGG